MIALLLAVALAGRGVAVDSAGRRAVDRGATDTTYVTSVDTTWYITNRARVDGRLVAHAADSLEFGFVVTRFRERAPAARDRRYLNTIETKVVDSVRLSRDEFTARVHSADAWAAARGEGAVLYVHGVATQFSFAVAQGAEIAHRGSYAGPFIVFAWPTRSVLRSWPTRRAWISRGYRDDSASARASEGAFRAALEIVLGATRPAALSIVTHSIGVQLVTEALQSPSPTRATMEAHPVASMAFYAADVSAARFADTVAPALQALAARRVVYASGKDRMLDISHFVNHSVRAGQRRGEQTVAGGEVEVVDVTNGRRVGPAWWNPIRTNHSMRAAGSALYDFFAIVRGLPEQCRMAGGIAERTGERTWKLTGAPIPSSPPVCTTH